MEGSQKRGEVKVRQETQTITVRAPVEVHDALRTYAFAAGKSINDVVLRAIGDFLASDGHAEAVDGFLTRAQDRYRIALDKLASL